MSIGFVSSEYTHTHGKRAVLIAGRDAWRGAVVPHLRIGMQGSLG